MSHWLRKSLFVLVLLPCVSLWADDWPQWRGPNRDGVWTETGTLQSFPPNGLKIRWRAPAGPGFSSPVVAQGRAYLIHSELIRPKAKERVRCFNAVTGEMLWTFAYEVAYPDWAFTPEPGMGPAATPIVQGKKLYTLGDKSNLVCLDALKGEVLWRRNLEKEYGVEEFCFNASPLIESDLLILCIGSYGGGTPSWVLALNKDSDKGDLIRARLTSNGYNEISRIRLVEPTYPYAGRKVVWPPPAYADHHVFARNDKELICASLAAEP
jgi:outer membrane protein assembly factor BamB